MKLIFITPKGMITTTKYLTDELIKKNIDVQTVILNSSSNPLYYYKLAKKVSNNCNIVHIQNTYWSFGRTGICMPFFYYFLSSKVITTLHEPAGHFHKGVIKYFTAFYYRWLAKITIKHSDKVLVSTEGKRQLDRMIKNDKKIIVAHRGSYQNPKILNKDQCKKQLGLSEKKVILLFGRVRYGKGYDIILDILPKLDKDSVIFIAGSPRLKTHDAYYKLLEEKAKAFPDRVIFYGYVKKEEIPVVFNAADIAVLPYRHSTQSDVIRMLLAFGIPSITSDLGFFRDIYNDYNCLQIYNNNDDLVKKINILLNDEKERGKLRGNSHRFWKDRRWENIAEKRIKLYEGLIENGKYNHTTSNR